MSDASLSESTVEAVALDWLASLGWAVARGPDVAPDTPATERADYGEVVLNDRLRSALAQLNPDLPTDALDDVLRRLTRPAGATLEARNRDFHRMVVAGVTVEHVDTDGRVRGDQVRVLDFDEPEANDWLAVNQFTVVENRHERRPDIVLFVNGLPLGVVELKHPTDENATIRSAFQQLQTYKAEIPSLFAFNAALVVSAQPPALAMPANKKKDPRYAEIYRDMPGYSGMRPRRLRPMIVGVPPRVGAAYAGIGRRNCGSRLLIHQMAFKPRCPGVLGSLK